MWVKIKFGLWVLMLFGFYFVNAQGAVCDDDKFAPDNYFRAVHKDYHPGRIYFHDGKVQEGFVLVSRAGSGLIAIPTRINFKANEKSQVEYYKIKDLFAFVAGADSFAIANNIHHHLMIKKPFKKEFVRIIETKGPVVYAMEHGEAGSNGQVFYTNAMVLIDKATGDAVSVVRPKKQYPKIFKMLSHNAEFVAYTERVPKWYSNLAKSPKKEEVGRPINWETMEPMYQHELMRLYFQDLLENNP
ncbi:hypothetical protein [Persicobacter sp. CCB-QB2]|uniref:hypothetical protein n=1 Tax=Persicobacter sp. CCB-QB2 TaxID=1561025 RepID=UPI0006A9DADE|nr:hypothetical protein [Persicobacter sp. CCB-QB2]